MHYAETKYGFEYGSAKVVRFASDDSKGWVIIGIETPKYQHAIQVYVTKTGKVRIYDEHGEWTPPPRPQQEKEKGQN